MGKNKSKIKRKMMGKNQRKMMGPKSQRSSSKIKGKSEEIKGQIKGKPKEVKENLSCFVSIHSSKQVTSGH